TSPLAVRCLLGCPRAFVLEELGRRADDMTDTGPQAALKALVYFASKRRSHRNNPLRSSEGSTGAGPLEVAWVEPHALPDELSPVPDFDDRLLPEALRPWLADVAERTQCPPEYAAAAALVALASVIGRGCAIRPKRHDDWTVVPNL